MLWSTWLKKQEAKQLERERERVNKFFENLEKRVGVVDDKAVVFVYNREAPELSYILVEQL